ncbi:uncharacterized protein [Hoplias malabaricus]
MQKKRKADPGLSECPPKHQRGVWQDESKNSTKELHNCSQHRGTYDPKLHRQRPASPEHSCVSMKRSMWNTYKFSKERMQFGNYIKKDHTKRNPLKFSSRRVPRPKSVQNKYMKSDRSKWKPPDFSSGREPSCVSMKSDQFTWNPPDFSSGREPSCVSMKNDRSMWNPPDFSNGRDPSRVSIKSDRSMWNPPDFSSGRDPSRVSMKSDRSMSNPPDFSSGRDPSRVSMKSDRSMSNPPDFSSGREPSCMSMKSDRSMWNPPDFSNGRDPSRVSIKSDRSMWNPPDFSSGREPSCVSMKSYRSMWNPPDFSSGREPSCVSMKGDRSMWNPPDFSSGREPSCVSMKGDRSMWNPPDFSNGRDPSRVSIKSDQYMKSFSEVSCGCVFSYESKKYDWSRNGAFPSDQKQHTSEEALQALNLEEGPGDLQQDSYPAVEEVLHTHRTRMKNRYENLFEGIRTPENKTPLNSIYIQLYIIEGESEGVNEEHEVLQMEKTPRKHQQDAPIHCSDIFKPLQGPEEGVKAEDLRLRDRKEDKGAENQEIRRVLTKGIAGIGKTVSVQKFIVHWAEGAANQEIDLMFVLPFRELNLIKDDQYSLHGLLCAFHPELRDLDPEIYDQLRAVFIFDGLDESRVPLDFKQCEKVSDITVTSSVGVLMTNLFRGDLLPSTLIWITSRPAAANQIPPRYIHRVTEIQGFTDPQKEEYFRKRIRDQDQAQKIISHIKIARSLHIMCHIPIFCLISATVLQRIITQSHTEIPTTLTEMYTHFLRTQTNMKKEKYEEKDERDTKKQLESNRTELLKLAELAFTQLLKGNVMFYEEDLRESSIDVTEASVYSGIFTEIFREECVIHQRKVYCFVHLSFQEFLAAVFVFHCYENNIMEPLQCFTPRYRGRSQQVPLERLLLGAVDNAIECQNGHLDLFLRFLLGLSLESNQSLLQGLLTQTHSGSERTTEYIKRLIKGNKTPISSQTSINLFLCLSEMKYLSLSRETEEYLNSQKQLAKKLSPGQCSALAYVILSSEEELNEQDLRKYMTSEEGYSRLIPAVTVCRKVLLHTQQSISPEPSYVSMKSDRSMRNPPEFNRGRELSHVSITSDRSMRNPPEFRRGRELRYVFMKSDQTRNEAVSTVRMPHSSQKALQTLNLEEGLGDLQQDSYPAVEEVLHTHRSRMKNRYENLFEGIRTPENKTLLNRVYTQLYIIEGESEGVNEEHEVLQMEKTPRKHQQDATIHCSDIFKPLRGPEEGVKAEDLRLRDRKEDKGAENQEIRSVLTKGIAGIGKTVSVQKFIVDWAEGAANQEIDLMFVLPFRELNLIKDDQYSLHGLLCAFHPELKDLDPVKYDQLRAVFIFDGLDESRVPLDFKQCVKVSDITVTSSVGVLMTNLFRGDLLPSTLIWITSRPAAANQIPPRYIHRVTEIQGFTDPQKEEYFRKRIRDQDQAQKIISHIKTARSLHIMCHIPVFCWISATVLQRIITQSPTEIPTTLTEMYTHFLRTQTNMKKEKYEEKDERDPKKQLESNRTELLNLAELAFTQLLKGNVMFYEEDLRESSIDVTEASVYSGIFTEIFREECVIHQRKVFCFVHLSFQEFLAAVFVFHCYENNIIEPLQCFTPRYRGRSEKVPLDDLLKGAVDKAIESQNGHLDLFLRFLLGLSLESNQSLLQGLLTPAHSGLEETTEYIKRLIKGQASPISTERSINLFLCLSEMKDQSLYRETEDYLTSEKHSQMKLSPGQCSAVAYMLLTSEEELEELDLSKYRTSEEGYRRLIPAVTVCRKARLIGCNLDSWRTIQSVLQSDNSSLKELDLSNNDLQDSGVELLSAGLKSSLCKLETLRLPGCNLTKNHCEALGSALQSVNSSLKELDLSNNDLQDSGVELLSAGLKSLHCKLETLRLLICNFGNKSCKSLGSVLQSVNSSLKELDLSNNDLQDSGVELLSAGLKSSFCKLETLRLSGCMITDEGCSSLASGLKLNPSHLRELDLSYNHPGESGVKLLSDLLQDPHCALEKLQVQHRGRNWIKPGLKKYSCNLTLDPNTTHTALSLSEGNRKVERVKETQPYPDHPERFNQCWQVLSVESLTGRCYWEVEWSGRNIDISVSYRGIGRKGGRAECVFGSNIFSWSLECFDDRYSVRHNNQTTVIPSPSHSNRVGVYLDWGSGTLSFYTISPHTHTLTHLHTFTSTFTEPLYTGFRVYYDSSVCLCETK